MNHLKKTGYTVRFLWQQMGGVESGTIDLQQLHTLIRRLGDPEDVADSEVKAFFRAAVSDGKGVIEYEQMCKLLRVGQDERLDKLLKPGACGEIETSRRAGPFELRGAFADDERQSRMLALSRSLSITDAVDKPILDQLFEAVRERKLRVVDLFRDWEGTRDWDRPVGALEVKLRGEGADLAMAQVSGAFDYEQVPLRGHERRCLPPPLKRI